MATATRRPTSKDAAPLTPPVDEPIVDSPVETTTPAETTETTGDNASVIETIVDAIAGADPKPEAAPAASTAPLEPPLLQVPAPTAPAPSVVKDVANSHRDGRILDAATREVPDDVDDLFEKVGHGSLMRSKKRLLKETFFGVHRSAATVLLVAQGSEISLDEAESIIEAINGSAVEQA